MDPDAPDSIDRRAPSSAIPLAYRSILDEEVGPGAGSVLAGLLLAMFGLLLLALGVFFGYGLISMLVEMGSPFIGALVAVMAASSLVGSYALFGAARRCFTTHKRIGAIEFTARCRLALSLADWEALRRGVRFLDDPYLMLGLIGAGPNAGVAILHALRVDVGALQRKLDALHPVRRQAKVGQPSMLPMTGRFQRIISGSIQEAETEQRRQVGTEHLLLALLQEEEGIVNEILSRQGIDARAVAAQLQHLRSLPPAEQGNALPDDDSMPVPVSHHTRI